MICIRYVDAIKEKWDWFEYPSTNQPALPSTNSGGSSAVANEQIIKEAKDKVAQAAAAFESFVDANPELKALVGDKNISELDPSIIEQLVDANVKKEALRLYVSWKRLNEGAKGLVRKRNKNNNKPPIGPGSTGPPPTKSS